MASKTIRVTVVGDARHVREALAEVGGASGMLDRQLDKLGRTVKGVFAGVGVALIARTGAALYDVGVQSEGYGRKFQAAFGGNAAELQRWAKAHHEAFGVAEDEVQGYLAQIGTLLTGMGNTEEEAGAQATQVLSLAAAWSAWSNGQISVQDASDKLVRGMLGQTRGLVELGLKVTEQEVAARMAAEGLDHLTGAEASRAQQQVMWQLIQEKSTTAVGAYDEAMEGAYGSAQQFKAGLDMLKDSAGELIVGLEPVVRVLGLFMGALSGADVSILSMKSGTLDAAAQQAHATQEAVLAAAEAAGFATGEFGALAHEQAVAWSLLEYKWKKGAGQTAVLGDAVRQYLQLDWAVSQALHKASLLDQTGLSLVEVFGATPEGIAALDSLQGIIREISGPPLAGAAARMAQVSGELHNVGWFSHRYGQEITQAGQELKDRTAAAVQATGDEFARLPELITAHKGDVRAAMAQLAEEMRQGRDFENNLTLLAGAGMNELAEALRNSPDRDAAILAAAGFAADLAAASSIEREMKTQTLLAIAAANPLNPTYSARWQAAADAWRDYGAAMAAAYAAGLSPTTPAPPPGGTYPEVPAADLHVSLNVNGAELADVLAADITRAQDRQRRSRR